jgi:hypothetical protein
MESRGHIELGSSEYPLPVTLHLSTVEPALVGERQAAIPDWFAQPGVHQLMDVELHLVARVSGHIEDSGVHSDCVLGADLHTVYGLSSLDDFGMKKLGSNAAEDLLEVFVRRHETASTLITTNRPTQDWGIFLGDVPAATAILDRFLAHATIVPVTAKSYRLRQRASTTDD